MIGRGVFSKKQVHITSKSEMDKEMKRIHDLFKKKEGEDTWEQFDQALKNIKVWATVDKIYQYPGFLDHIKLLKQPIISSLNSARSRLSGTASDLLQSLSQAMQRKYEIIHELFMPTLIQLFSRSNKVQLRTTLTCFKAIVENSKVPRTTHRLCMILRQNNNNDNISKATRYHVTECLNTVIQVNATTDLSRYIGDIEAAIDNTAMDPAPEVRSSIRTCYKLYCEKFPEQAAKFSEKMSPGALRYLQVSSGNRASGSKSTLVKSRSITPLRNNKDTHPPQTANIRRKDQVIPSPSSSRARSAIPLSARYTSPSTSSSSTSSSSSPLKSRATSKAPATASYLSATASSAAKVSSHHDLSARKRQPINLPSKYLGQNAAHMKLEPGFRVQPPSLILGKPVLRQKVQSPRKEQEGQSPPSNDQPAASLKRPAVNPPLHEEDTNPKRIKTLE